MQKVKFSNFIRSYERYEPIYLRYIFITQSQELLFINTRGDLGEKTLSIVPETLQLICETEETTNIFQ